MNYQNELNHENSNNTNGNGNNSKTIESITTSQQIYYYYSKFTKRIRNNLHIVLAFSPFGDLFRNRLRMFPSLVNCSTIDFYQVSLW